MAKKNSIQLKKGLSLGRLDAAEDIETLKECFVDSGYLEQVTAVDSPSAVLLGRTGSGKTALVLEIQRLNENVKYIDPNEFAFTYIENSNVISFFEECGVNLQPFYRLLWRHVIIVELLKMKYNIESEYQKARVVEIISNALVRDKRKKQAIDYFRLWGDSFWESTEVRVKEIISNIETKLSASGKGKAFGSDLSAAAAHSLTEEAREEILERGRKVVSDIQIRDLNDIVKALAKEVFSDQQQKFYVLIDQLDEGWSQPRLRSHLIRALLDEVKHLRSLNSVKVIVALRNDVLAQVFDTVPDASFQREKYYDYLVPIQWSEKNLKDLIHQRINYVFRNQYTKQGVQFEDVFTSRKIDGKNSKDYILSRTLKRPRDVIQLVNDCFVVAEGSPEVSPEDIHEAEFSYSRKRMESLCDEWRDIYPCLNFTLLVLEGKQSQITRSDIDFTVLESAFDQTKETENDPVLRIFSKLYENESEVKDSQVVTEIIRCLFKIGVLGIKIGKRAETLWADAAGAASSLSASDAKRAESLEIHPMLFRALGVRVAVGKKSA